MGKDGDGIQDSGENSINIVMNKKCKKIISGPKTFSCGDGTSGGGSGGGGSGGGGSGGTTCSGTPLPAGCKNCKKFRKGKCGGNSGGGGGGSGGGGGGSGGKTC